MALNLLSGIRVLELASMVSGPFCGRLLAFSGAEVVKTEPPFRGDPSRHAEPFAQDIPGPDRSLLYQYLNFNKKGITLDVTTPTGREIFKRLVQWTDILIEDLPPGYLGSLGLSYPELEQVNQRLIMVSITPFGQYGQHSHWKAHNLNTTHIGGGGWITPSGLSRRMFPDRPPLKFGGHIGDYYCGVTAATAAMFAIFDRDSQGQGQHIDMSKQEAHLTLERGTVSRWVNYGFVETADTNDFPYGGCYPCKDGYVEILAHEDGHWDGLVNMMGRPGWATKDVMHKRDTRRLQGEIINPGIARWLARYSRGHIYRLGLRHGVPVGMFSTPIDVVRSRHENERGFLAKVAESDIKGMNRVPALPFQTLGEEKGVERRAPNLGEHNKEILCDTLGLPRQELVKLAGAEII